MQSDEIKGQIRQADKKTREMNRRNICIKLGLYIVILVLFVAVVTSLIYKVSTSAVLALGFLSMSSRV